MRPRRREVILNTPPGPRVTLPDEMVRFRAMKRTDENMLFSFWLHALRNDGAFAAMSNDEYFDKMQRLIVQLVSQSAVVIACDPDNEDFAFGFAVGLPAEVKKTEDGQEYIAKVPVIHMIFVKPEFRRHGIAHKLAEVLGYNHAAGAVYTIDCKVATTIRRTIPHIRYDQFYAWGIK